MHRLRLYTEFFRTFPIEHQLAVALPSPATTVIGFAFDRARGDFTEAERDVLSVPRAADDGAGPRYRAAPGQARSDCGQRQPSGRLTGRELQILDLVAQGRTNGYIARTLGVSPRTIAKHLEHIYRKLGVTSRAAAVHRATAR